MSSLTASAASLWTRLQRDRRWQNVAMVLVLLATGLFLLATSERIPQVHGLGFDGALYGQWAIQFGDVVSGKLPLTPYQALRILPSAIAHGVLWLLGAKLSPENVIRFFEAYNLTLLCLAALAWGSVADILKISWRGKLLGFLGLFGNHAILKFNFYYPVLTDVSGYACAVFLLWAYLRHKFLPLMLITVVGAFCWPPLLIYGAIALLFPRRDQQPSPPATGLGLGAAALVAGGYCVLAVTSPAVARTPYYPLAMAVVMVYLAGAMYVLFASPYPLGPMLRQAISPTRLAVFAVTAAVILAGRLLVGQVVVAGSGGRGFFNQPLLTMVRLYLQTTCVPLSMRFPGEFLVAHALYFGPLLFLTGLFPRQVAQAAGRFGLGFFLLVLVAVSHAIMPLSRQWLVGYPILVLATVLAMEDWSLSRGFFLCFTGFSLFVSKVWMLFNVSRAPGVTQTSHDAAVAYIGQFSFDAYISSTGRWMSLDWYLAQGLVLSVAFLCFIGYFYAPKAVRRGEER